MDHIAKTLAAVMRIRSSGRLCKRMLRPKWLVIPIVLLLLAVVTQAQSATEYQVKAAFLFNFAKFVEWPPDSFASDEAPLQICILGLDPFGHDFQQAIEDKTVNGHRLEVVHPSGVTQARACQIVFVGVSDKGQISQILGGLRGSRVLTVGDSSGFARMGGMINFVLDDNRVRFEINLKASERAHLKVSARLLTVAKILVTAEEPEAR